MDSTWLGLFDRIVCATARCLLQLHMVTTTRDDFSGKCACDCRVDVRAVDLQTETTRISLGLDDEFSSCDCDQYESVFVLSPLNLVPTNSNFSLHQLFNFDRNAISLGAANILSVDLEDP